MNSRTRKFKTFILGAAALAFYATAAHATVITYTTASGGGGSCSVTLGNGQTSNGADCTQLQVTDYTWQISLPKFNVANAVLNSVSIFLYENTDVVTLSATNNSGSSGTVYLVAAVKPWASQVTNSAVAADKFANPGADYMTLYDSTSGANVGANPANLGSCANGQTPQGGCTGGTVLANTASTGNLGGYSLTNTNSLYTTDSSWIFTTGTGLDSTNPVTGITLTDSSHNSSYTGSGAFTLGGATTTLFTGQFSAGGGAGTISFTKNIQTQFSAEVDYNYSSIVTPEPATYGLMGSALLALGAFARKRHQKRRG